MMRLIEHHGDRPVRVLRADHPNIEQCRQYVVQEVLAYIDERPGGSERGVECRIVKEYPVTGWTFWATKDQMIPPD